MASRMLPVVGAVVAFQLAAATASADTRYILTWTQGWNHGFVSLLDKANCACLASLLLGKKPSGAVDCSVAFSLMFGQRAEATSCTPYTVPDPNLFSQRVRPK
jgi:hypothetical protein